MEGPGDREAVALLVRNYLAANGIHDSGVSRPLSSNGKSKLLKHGELERFVRLAGSEPGVAAVIVVFDADASLACEEGPAVLARARSATHVPVKVCIAVPKFENWLLASGHCLFDSPIEVDDAEAVGALGAIKKALEPRKYVKSVDQARLAARVDAPEARLRARSLDRFFRVLDEFADCR